jgi:hypothetical protein
MNRTDRNDKVKFDQPRRVFGGSVFAVYFLTVLFGILTLAILDTLLNRYYGVNGSIPTFLPSDKPSDIFQPGCVKSVIGEHYFGDFQSEYCRMRGATPYSSEAPSLYLPGFYVLLSFISLFTSVISSWVVVTILSVLFLVATIKTQLRSKSPLAASIILLATFNPFWQTIDRGNFSWMLGVGLVVLGAKSEVKSERGWLLAVAVSLKIQLAPFLLILLNGGNVRDKLRMLVHFALVFISLNFIFPLIGWRDFGQFYPNLFESIRSPKPLNNTFDYGFRSLTYIVTQLNWSILFWVFFLLFTIVLTVCLVFINMSDHLLDRRDANEDFIVLALFAASMIVLCSPRSYLYGLMVLLAPTVLIVGMESRARLIHKVQLVLVTICVLPNTISLDSLIDRQMHSPNAEMLTYPNLGNLIPSLILPSVAFSAVIIGCMDFRHQRIMKRMMS